MSVDLIYYLVTANALIFFYGQLVKSSKYPFGSTVLDLLACVWLLGQ